METSTQRPPMMESLREAALLWDRVEHLTTEACILRREGREDLASKLLSEELPPLLREWSLVCGLDTSVRKERLKALITDTQKTVESAFLQRRLIVEELMHRIDGKTNLGAAKVQPNRPVKAAIFGLRHKVPISDVCGMIDAINESISVQECEDLLPMRSVLMRH